MEKGQFPLTLDPQFLLQLTFVVDCGSNNLWLLVIYSGDVRVPVDNDAVCS